MKLRSGKTSLLLQFNNAKCIHFSVARVIQAMSATHANTYTNKLKNTEDRQLETISESSTIKDEIKVREDKLPLVSQQCVVYSFQCGLCDAGYVSYMCRHLHQRIEEHKGSAIRNHPKEQHDMEPEDITQNFRILRKCQNKLDCLIFEVFFYKRSETNAKQTVQFNLRQLFVS